MFYSNLIIKICNHWFQIQLSFIYLRKKFLMQSKNPVFNILRMSQCEVWNWSVDQVDHAFRNKRKIWILGIKSEAETIKEILANEIIILKTSIYTAQQNQYSVFIWDFNLFEYSNIVKE
ncbi:hypothetical protein pb186bvf_005373 [Paramecium bursaria]